MDFYGYIEDLLSSGELETVTPFNLVCLIIAGFLIFAFWAFILRCIYRVFFRS